jgi:hypothetical protein
MKLQSVCLAITTVNFVILVWSFVDPHQTNAQASAPTLRGRALELVDDQGRVRAEIKLFPPDPSVKMPDGSTGYPETVLLRLINSKGRPNVKISATEDGSAISFGGEADPTNIQLLARGTTTLLKLTNKDGRQQLLKP